MRRAVIVLTVVASAAALSWLASPAATAAPTQGVTTEVTITMPDGNDRLVHYYVPTGLNGPAPLVVALHGLYNDWSSMRDATSFDALAEAHQFVVAYPTGLDGSWNAGTCCGYARDHQIDDVTYLDMVIDRASTLYPIDPSRIHMAGFSAGGMMAYRYACDRSERISSIVVDATTMVAPSCAPTYPVSVFQMHSDTDKTVPFRGCSNGRVGTGCSKPDLTPNLPSVPSVLAQWQGFDRSGCSSASLKLIHHGPHMWPTFANVKYNGSEAAWSYFWAHPRMTAPTGQDPGLPQACILLNNADVTTKSRPSDKIVFSGSVRPAKPGTQVVIQSRRHRSGSWKNVKYLRLTSRADQQSAYSWTWRPTAVGDRYWRIRWSDAGATYFSGTAHTIIRLSGPRSGSGTRSKNR